MDAAAMDRMAKHYWAMWGAAGVRSGWPAAHGGGGEPSWEEQAFARDAAGHLGGCVWPPRSYTCSFCRREFRSAQALGGHMNVHRRDRARLRQGASSPDHDDPLQLQQPISLCGPPPPPPPDQLLHQPAVQRALPRRLSSPKSITGDRGLQATMAATASDANYSCIATIIKESKNKALFISMPATAATARESSSTFLGGAGDNGDDDDDEGVKEIRRKRRRVDLERGVPVHDHDPAGAKVTMVASPSSSSSPLLVHHHHHHHELVDERQELDLELRLGTSPA